MSDTFEDAQIDGARIVFHRIIAIGFSVAFSFQLTLGPSVVALARSHIRKSTGLEKTSRQKAVRVWEQAIAAKGGRQRLYGVRNLLISGSQGYTSKQGSANRVLRESLYVVPDKYWFYDEYSSDRFGVRMHMYDYSRNLQYVGAPGDPQTRLESIMGSERIKRPDNSVISLLLETRWLKPIPVRATVETIGSKKVDVVETIVNNSRVDFAFNKKTHLLIRITFYNIVSNKTYTDVQHFSDYVDVGGIKVPLTVNLDDGTEEKSTIQFNVEYNSDVFAKPPPSGAGPKAWRPSSTQTGSRL
jgi:hypothetical protein